VKSVRIDPDLERRLARAAAVRGETVSEFIRQAAADRADATLSMHALVSFDDILGVVKGGGGQAERTGAAFTDIVAERARRE